MKLTRLIIILTLFVYSCCAMGKNCPSSPKEWREKLFELADSVTPDLGNKKIYHINWGPQILDVSKYQNIIRFWDLCKDKAGNSVSKLYSNILTHSQYMIKVLGKGHSGLYLSDEQYLKEFKAEASLSKLPEPFFENQYLPENWEDILKGCNKNSPLEKYKKTCKAIEDWIIVPFFSTIQDGAGHFDRLVVYIPGKYYEKFYIFSPKEEHQLKRKIISIIVFKVKEPSTGKQLANITPVFIDKYDNGFSYSQGRCLMCHPNGLREIHPIKGSYISNVNYMKLKKINNVIKKYAPKVDWGVVHQHEKIGPPLGDSCIECHSTGKSRKPLDLMSYPPMILSKIHEREMPYGELYSGFDEVIDRLNRSKNEKLKLKVHKMIVRVEFKPSHFYRTKEQVEIARSQVLEVLKEEGFISMFEYFKIISFELVLTPFREVKTQTLFKNYKKEFNEWLKGGVPSP